MDKKERFEKPAHFPHKIIKDKTTGREIHLLSLGHNTIRPYVTQQQWTMDGSRLIVGDQETKEIFEYNIRKETLRFLDDDCLLDGSCRAYLTPKDELFYIRKKTEVWKINLNTYEKKLLATAPEERRMSGIQVTDDGKYATFYWWEQADEKDFFNGENRIRIVPRLNCETGEWDTTTITHCFDDIPKHPNAGHPIINPVYENLALFCHEGRTSEIPDRIWLGDFHTGEKKNLFVQAEYEDGQTGETCGHELWGANGEWVYFVKYGDSINGNPYGNLGQSGVVRIKKDGTCREYINDDWVHWHCYPSRDDRWVASDTQLWHNSRAEVILSSTESYRSYLLADFELPHYRRSHPFQPHPVISPDGRSVSWQMIDPRTGILCAAWMDISDITSISHEGGWKKWGEVEYLSRKNTVSEVTEEEDGILVSAGNALFVRSEKKGDNVSAEIEVTYLDEGKEPLVLKYTTGITGKKDLANRENAEMQLPREDSGKWVTKQIYLDSVNLNSAGRFLSDICLCGSTKIRSVCIK